MFITQEWRYKIFWAFSSLVIVGFWQILPVMAKVVPQPFLWMNQNPWSACDLYFSYYEKQYNVPAGLLRSVALVESGRYYAVKGEKVPWPWTVNVEGEGFIYTTKAEAVTAVQKAQKQGKASIDVGCMQVNLKWHSGVFDNLEQAFEPYHNISYAAQFLVNLKDSKGSWEKAVSFYHSATKGLSEPYKEKVMNHWSKELNKKVASGFVPQQTLEQMNKQVLVKQPRKPSFSYMVPYPQTEYKAIKESMWQTLIQHNDDKNIKGKSRVTNQDNDQDYAKDKEHPLSAILSD